MTEDKLNEEQQVIFNKALHKILQEYFALKQNMPESETIEGSKLDIAIKSSYALRDEYDSIPF